MADDNMSDEDRTKKLRKTRASFKCKMTQFEKYLNLAMSYEVLTDQHVAEVELRLSKMENMYTHFDNLQNQLEELCEPPDEQFVEREMFENQYYHLISSARQLLIASSTKEVSSNVHNNTSSAAGSIDRSGTCDNLHLPKIQIPSYNGSYLNWLEFRDTFVSMIHNNDKIGNISKFHYLRASLQGSAAIVIKNLDFSDSNYMTAWNLLCERYDNNRLLVNNHVHALFNVEPMSKESSRSIRYLLDVTNKNIRALSLLKQPTEHWDTLIIHMMSNKLDSVTLRHWEEHRNSLSDAPTLLQFTAFMHNRADLLETLEESKLKHVKCDQTKSKSFVVVTDNSYTKNKQFNKCPLCKDEHILFHCDKFRDLSIENRVEKAKELKVCLNCLRPGHSQIKCRFSNCRYCRYKHSTLLHLEKSEPAPSVPIQGNVDVALSASTNTSQSYSTPYILLSTALVNVYDHKGNTLEARLLLDNGSSANFVTQDLCNKLKLSQQASGTTVTGICNQHIDTSQSCNLKLKSRVNDNYQVNINCIVVPKITTSLPSKLLNVQSIPLPSGIQLADPAFYIPAAIDILVGAEIFWDVICNNSISLGKKQPNLCETKLGWLVSGYVPHATVLKNIKHQCHFLNHDDNVAKFWELDSVSSKYSLTNEERACEEHFASNTKRNDEGRFVVTMPLKGDPNELGDSFYMAKTRFLSLERRFEKDPNFKNQYNDFIQEYESLGHMSLNKTTAKHNSFQYFLPHHGVLRESSTTTKLRTVFDASAATSSGVSLNDIQMVGPTVQDDLLSIIIRFRQHKFVISGDIEKMYRAVLINPIQRPLQQIIYRSDPSQPLKTYTLNTVTYGTASAPYLATKCLSSLASTVSDTHVKEAITHDFYVDDYLSGGATEKEVIHQTNGIISVLSSAKFNLRKFQSNSFEILKSITEKDYENYDVLNLHENSQCNPSKTLGLHWLCDSDTLSYSININYEEKVTKRHILSVISQIFDPLGLVGLAIVELKILMQKLWQSKLDWDSVVPNDIKLQWIDICSKLPHLNNIKIPRWILQDSYKNIELHVFTDSSEKAYGACIYARSISNTGKVHVQLITSKNKVAPIKPTTIPRLELCGALLGARLCSKVLNSLRLQVTCRYWCDSTIVLCWLQMPAERLKPFVRNRVNEINDTTAGSLWGYVPSLDNPADLVSRGVKADLVSSSVLWWSGPQFLQNDTSTWPKMPNSNEKRELPEVVCHLTHDTPHSDNTLISSLIHRHSNFTRLVHVVAYLKRFISNCKNRQHRSTGTLSKTEIESSHNIIINKCQQEMFPEQKILLAGKSLPPKNRLLSLSPFIDENSLIRVGGRLENSPYGFDQKHPILLCSKHHITKLIFCTQHKKLLHTGPLALLYNIRQTYWPLGGRNLAKSTVNKCTKCFRQNARNVQPIMGQLRSNRTSLQYPFYHCCVDNGGPVMIADKKGRGCKLIRSYLCIFVCLASRAVHLELVTELSKDAYLAALHRFVSRRGKPRSITSDNGTNFVGAGNELNSLFSSDLVSELADEGIEFIYSPVYSPHFNGMAEAAVRSVKGHLRKILQTTHLTFEEMYTCLTQIEAILNSRPITPMSSDPLDMVALTPGHFLIGRFLTAIPCKEPPENANINVLRRYKRVEAIRSHFWRRFSNDYVSTLQQKTKWHTNKSDLKEGTLVIIRDKTSPPLLWPLGRIIKTYPGTDGVNRVADVKTKRGTIRRAWNNLCPLPLEDL